jgi:hypothetical protein
VPATQLAGFTARFGPKPAALVKTLRTQLRRRLPHAHELVYNYNHACVISYGPTDRPYHAPLSLSVQASGVSLYFLGGPTLPDPKKLLQGTGKQVRFVPLPSAAAFASPDVASLIAAAVQAAPVPFDPTLRPGLIIKSNSAKPGRRRAAVPARAKSKIEIRNSKI